MEKISKILIAACALTFYSVTAVGQCSYTANYVPKPIKQASSYGCWATVLTMMYEYKERKVLTVPVVLNRIGGPYKKIYDVNRGLTSGPKKSLIAAAGLKGEVPANYSLEGWCDLLNKYGPLWVTTDELPDDDRDYAIHARLLYVMVYDSKSKSTSMFFIDPATGTTKIEDFNDFTPKYEAELKKDFATLYNRQWPDNYEIRIMVIHW